MSVSRVLLFLLINSIIVACAHAQVNPPPHHPPYPQEWWIEVDKSTAHSWEILPQEARYGEVILSKRTELGILSNFAATPFTFRGKHYASLEGFWQATKYPENSNDPRLQDPRVKNGKIKWPHTRAQVEQMVAFDAKRAGDLAGEIMTALAINWVSFEGQQMIYKASGESEFYKLILAVMKEKKKQNPEVARILKATGDLILRPDHVPGPDELKAWQYHKIWMRLRAQE